MTKTREDILEKVYIQLTKDIYLEDFTAIEDLLSKVLIENLIEYLPEEEREDVNSKQIQT